MRDLSILRRDLSRLRSFRRAAVVLSTASLVGPLTLLGVNAGAAATEATADSPHDRAGSSTASASSGAGVPLPGGIDGAAWRYRMIQEAAAGNHADPRASADAVRLRERETAGATGHNDRLDGAERAPRPQARHDWELRIDGSLSTDAVRPVEIEPNREDDGAIPLARDLELGDERRGITTTGRIGDGPHGSVGAAIGRMGAGPHGSVGAATGDYDFYRLDASDGDTLTVDAQLPVAPGVPTPNVLLYDADGHLVIGALDTTGNGKAHLSFPIEREGAYFVAIGSQFPADPFDPGSGPGAIAEGPYQLDVTLRSDRMADTDMYAVLLREGDVLGATVTGSARRIAIHGSDGRLLQASSLDSGLIYPDESPLPSGGNATADHVVHETGLYFFSISDGSGDYSVTVGSHRAPSTTGEPVQTIHLDFSGPMFDNRGFGGSVVEPGVRDLSPMRDFLPRWGLAESDERAVIEDTTERVEQILREDVPNSKVRVTNSVEHPDMFGKPGVSRVIIGGTVEESGLFPAFGFSESIDPGNFDRDETAIVMPDRMSDGDQAPSLNAFLTDDSDRVRAVAQALGNVAGHEAGHFLGSFHTDDYDEHTNVMNTGNLLHFYATGPDGVAGTSDDDVIAMGTSRYDPVQGQSGTENTTKRTGVALR